MPQARDTRRLPRPKRAILIVLDSVGTGELPDAALYGDQGSDTLGHIAQAVGLRVPTLRRLGLDRGQRCAGNRGRGTDWRVWPHGRGVARQGLRDGSLGADGARARSCLPDVSSGLSSRRHEGLRGRIGRGTIGNIPASGTAIIDSLGPEHISTGKPIVYTSADSVFQIAAHEEIIPVPELYRYCEIAFELAGVGLGVGRVIARPFVGVPGDFKRTANRRDFALTPFAPTLLDRMKDAGQDGPSRSAR